MAKSINQVQAELLNSQYLENLGRDSKDYLTTDTLPVVKKLLADACVIFIETAREELNKQGRVSTGTLSDDLASSEIKQTSSSVSIIVGYPKNSKGVEYYDYVNKGVRGIKSGKPNSPYKFRKLYVSDNFVSAILSWVKKNNLANQRKLKPKNRLERKRANLSKLVDDAKSKKELAYGIAKKIKREGLKKSGYFDKAKKAAFGEEFNQLMAKAVAGDIQVIIKQYGNNNQ